jgi:hypothetical protein
LIVQAALNIPRGLGVITCDTEEYGYHRVEEQLHELFRPFSECERAEKAFLYDQIPRLLEQLEMFANQWKSTRMMNG